MIRVMMAIGAGAGFQAGRGVEQVARGVGEGFEVLVRRVGVGGDFANVPSAVLKRVGVGADVVHAWGMGSFVAAVVGGAKRVVFSPEAGVTRRQVGWVRAAMGYRDVQVVCSTSTMRRRMVEGGVPLERCHLIRPGVDFGRVRGRRDAGLREALGFGEEDRVLLAVGESTRAADHRQAVWAGAILNVLDHRTRVLVWGRGAMAAGVERFGRKLAQPELVTLAEQRLGRGLEFEELLPAADVLVVSATGAVETLPIAIGMAAGLPIVATVTPTVSELLEDRHTALMVRAGVPRLLAQKVVQLREDRQTQWSISDMARTEAFEFFTVSRMVEQWRGVYQSVARGERVEVGEGVRGVGLRFHGRG